MTEQLIYIAVMAVITYLIRVLPITVLLPVGIVLVRGKWVEKHCKEEKSGV